MARVQTKPLVFALLGVVLLLGLGWIAIDSGGARPLESWDGSASPDAEALEMESSAMRGEGDRTEVVDSGVESEEPPVLEEEPEGDLDIGITGRVVDAFSRPVAGASVTLQVGRSLRGRRGFVARGVGGAVEKTGSDGRFAFRERGFAESAITLQVTHRAHAPLLSDHSLARGETDLDVGDLQLPVGGTLIGTIADAGGVGIPGAKAVLIPERDNRLRWLRNRDAVLPPVKTDNNGFFRMQHVAAGDYRIEASAPSYERELSNPITVTEGEEEHLDPIRLASGHTLTGIVLSANSKPIAGAEVTLYPARGRDEETKTDAQGRFSFDHLRGDGASVRVTATGYITYHREGVDPSSREELLIQLDRGLGVTGVVRDVRGGTPVLRYAARIRRVGNLPEGVSDVESGPGRLPSLGQVGDTAQVRREAERRRRVSEGRRGRWSPNGRGPEPPWSRRAGAWGGDIGEVTDREAGRFVFKGMDEGVYEIDIQSPEHQRLTSDRIELRRNEPAPFVVLSVERGVSVRGSVSSASDGVPVEGATVDLVEISDDPDENLDRPRSPMRMLFQRGGRRGPPLLSGTTDASGRFVLPHAPPGRYAVLARASGFAEKLSSEFDLRRDVEGVDVELGQLARLAGTVLGVTPGSEAETRVLAFAGPGQMYDAVIEPDGSYALEDLQPGSYVVRAFVGSMRSFIRSQMRELFGRGEGQLEFDVVLAEGDDQAFNPVLSVQAVGTVTGSIVVNGSPARGVRVSLQPQQQSEPASREDSMRFRFARERFRTRTNQDGEFEMEEVPEGPHLLVVQAADQRNELYRGAITVQRGTVNDQRLSLETVVLAGEVTAPDADTSELRGSIRLYFGAEAEPEDRRAFAETERYYSIRVSDGAFEEGELAPGDYLMVLRISGRDPVEQQISLVPGMAKQIFRVGAER